MHWPFCLSKCPYCDFNSHVRHAPIDEERFSRAFAREIETTAARAPGREVSSIFLGGGTPSLMEPQTVGAILDAIGKHWRVAPDAEVTLEANPTSVEATRFKGYRTAGVNRVSLGVQALDDASLKALGRLHTAREALDAVAIARTAFDRYSFDLIYARPDQTPEMWADELNLAIAEAAEHLSLYQLTIEPETPFLACMPRQTEDAGGATARALYDVATSQRGTGCRLRYQSRALAPNAHNLVYWRGEEYAGIGPGAHGRLDINGVRHAVATEKRPEAWLMRVEASGHGVITDDRLNSEERADEFLLMGLRLAEGIDPARYAALSGRALDPRRIKLLREQGAISVDASGRLRVTQAGFPVLELSENFGGSGCLGSHATAKTLQRIAGGRDGVARPDAHHGKAALLCRRRGNETARQCRQSRMDWSGLRARTVAALAFAPAPRPARPRHRPASRCAPDQNRIWRGSGPRNCGSRQGPARHKGRPAMLGLRIRADCPTGRCRAIGCFSNWRRPPSERRPCSPPSRRRRR